MRVMDMAAAQRIASGIEAEKMSPSTCASAMLMVQGKERSLG